MVNKITLIIITSIDNYERSNIEVTTLKATSPIAINLYRETSNWYPPPIILFPIIRKKSSPWHPNTIFEIGITLKFKSINLTWWKVYFTCPKGCFNGTMMKIAERRSVMLHSVAWLLSRFEITHWLLVTHRSRNTKQKLDTTVTPRRFFIERYL